MPCRAGREIQIGHIREAELLNLLVQLLRTQRSINHGWTGQEKSFGQVVTCDDSARCKDDHVTMSLVF